MREKNKTTLETMRTAVAFALVYLMIWSGIPAPALAEMAEESIEAASFSELTVELQEPVNDPSAEDDSDELYAGYVQHMLDEALPNGAGESAEDDEVVAGAQSAKQGLEGSNLYVYNELRAMAEQVAAGGGTNTSVDIKCSSLPEGYRPTGLWTASDLQLSSLANKGMLDAALSKMGIDYNVVFSALVADCPYELYWFDKTNEGLGVGASYATGTVDGQDVVSFENATLTFSMYVIPRYSASNQSQTTEVRSDLVSSVSAAIATAQGIVNDPEKAEMTVLQRLAAYKDAVCGLVTYDDAAAGGSADDGSPWQLISVFDGDTDTNVVCEGYSKAFKYLCDMTWPDRSDVECLIVTGMMDGGQGAGPHMWNVVRMDDGRNYLVDVTNCDEGTVGYPSELFMAFGPTGGYDTSYTFALGNGRTIAYAYNQSEKDYFGEAYLTISDQACASTSGFTEVAVPEAASDLVYNGSEQTGVAAGTGYTLSGDTAQTDAGEYTATATLADGYKWSDGTTMRKTITWSIARKPVTVTADDKTKGVGEVDPELTATVEGTVGDDAVAYTLSRAAGEDVGGYSITPTGDAEQGNYDVTYVQGTFTIENILSLANCTVSCTSVAREESGELRPWGISVKDNEGNEISWQAYDVSVEVDEGNDPSMGDTVTVKFEANGWDGGITGENTCRSQVGLDYNNNKLVARTTVITERQLDDLKENNSSYIDLGLTYDGHGLYDDVQFHDGGWYYPSGNYYQVTNVSENDNGKKASITVAPSSYDPIYYGEKTFELYVLDGTEQRDLSQATQVTFNTSQEVWFADGSKICPEILSFVVPVIADNQTVGTELVWSPQTTSDFEVTYVNNDYGPVGTITVAAASDSTDYTGSFSKTFDIFNLANLDLTQEGVQFGTTGWHITAENGQPAWLTNNGQGIEPDVNLYLDVQYNEHRVQESIEGDQLEGYGIHTSYTNNTTAGTGRITFSNNISDKTRTIDFVLVDSVPIGNVMVTTEKELYPLGGTSPEDYTRPKLKEYDDFKENVDFVYGTYTYSDPGGEGNVTCTIRYKAKEGQTRYTNEKDEEGQDIWCECYVTLYNKKDFSECTLEFEDQATNPNHEYEYKLGEGVEPPVVLKDESGEVLVAADGWNNAQQQGFSISCYMGTESNQYSPTECGSATVRVTAMWGSEYLGDDLYLPYTITPYVLSNKRLTSCYWGQYYWDNPNIDQLPSNALDGVDDIEDWVEQNLVVHTVAGEDESGTPYGRDLWYGTHYELDTCTPAYDKNNPIGQYTLHFKGIGNCTGSFDVELIVGRDLGDEKQVEVYDIQDSYAEYQVDSLSDIIHPQVWYGNTCLEEDTDYTVAIDIDRHAGKGTVTITGKGECHGQYVKEFSFPATSLIFFEREDNRTYMYTDGDFDLVLNTDELEDAASYSYSYTVEVPGATENSWAPAPVAAYTVDAATKTVTLHGNKLTSYADKDVRVSATATKAGQDAATCETYIWIDNPNAAYYASGVYNRMIAPTDTFSIAKRGRGLYHSALYPSGAEFDYTTTVRVASQNPKTSGKNVVEISAGTLVWNVTALNPGTANLEVTFTKPEEFGGATETRSMTVTVLEDTYDVDIEMPSGNNTYLPNGSFQATAKGVHRKWNAQNGTMEVVEDGITYEWEVSSYSDVPENFVTITKSNGGKTASVQWGDLPNNQSYLSVDLTVVMYENGNPVYRETTDGESVRMEATRGFSVTDSFTRLDFEVSPSNYENLPVNQSITVTPKAYEYSIDYVDENNTAGRILASNPHVEWYYDDDNCTVVGPDDNGAYTVTRLSADSCWLSCSVSWTNDLDESCSTYGSLDFEPLEQESAISLFSENGYFKSDSWTYVHAILEGIPMGPMAPVYDVEVQTQGSDQWTAADSSFYRAVNGSGGIGDGGLRYRLRIDGSKLTEAGVVRVRIKASIEVGGQLYESEPLVLAAQAADLPVVDLSEATVTFPEVTYNGNAQTPEPQVTVGNVTLVKGEDYTLGTYTNNTNATTADSKASVVLTATENGRCDGTKTAEFEIAPATITEVTGVQNVTYTGEAIRPVPVVKAGTLVLGANDYDVEYDNNTDAGTATVTVTGKGNFTGTGTVYFTILPKAITANDIYGIEESADFTGSAITMPVEVVVDGHNLQPRSLEDPAIGDYVVAYASNTDAGPATITVTGCNNYTGTVTKTFTINPVALDSDSVVVSGVEEKEHTGSSITQENLTLTLGNYTLAEGTDYTVAYADNTSKGEATITITAAGANFTGSRTVTFNITGKVLTEDNTTVGTIGDYTYDGTAKTPDPEVKVGDRALLKGTDYELSYSNNTAAGTATVTVTGKGDFGGMLTRRFTINPAEITGIVAIPEQTYTGQAIEPALTVKAGDLTLAATDYDAVFSANTDAGTASVTVTAKGNFTGTKTASFTISPFALTDQNVTGIDASATFTGSAITPEPVVTVDGKTLTKGTDYEVAYANNKNAGTATVTVTGRGNYAGTVTSNFTINAVAIDSASVTLSGVEDATYTGSAITQSGLTLTLGSYELTADDYTVEYANNTNAGTATVTIKGAGINFTGTKTGSFTISPATITDSMIDAIPDQTFTGATIEPEPVVKLGDVTLIKGTDYDVSYSSNVHVGTATVTVSAKENGNFTGSASKTFTIKPAMITSIDTIENQTYTGAAITPAPVVKVGDQTISQSNYTVSYANNTNAGRATVTVTGTGDYSGTVEANFTIEPRAITANDVTGIVASVDYTGSAITMPVVVTSNGRTLQQGNFADPNTGDYAVEHTNNTNAGTATVTVTGRGNYTGTVEKTFTINAVAIDSEAVTLSGVSNKVYTGSPITMENLALKLGNYTLVKGTDYTVAYADHTNAGTATITITAAGTNFTGMRTKTFTIAAKSLATATIENVADQAYTGSAITPTPAVILDGAELVAGTDFEYGYQNNINAGTATITITGKGNYTGTVTQDFTINPVALDSESIEISGVENKTYTGSAITMENLALKLGSYTLVAGTDYTVAYADNTDAGTATITFTAAGTNCTGTRTKTFTIAGKSLATATVASVDDQNFTGFAITPTPAVILDGAELVAGTDFDYGYQNNTNFGQATVTITGKGNYADSVTKTFTINPVALDSGSVVVSGVEEKEYTGSSITQENLTLTLGTYTLIEDTDYTVEYWNNINKGQATITIKAKSTGNGGSGNFTGSRTEHFNITGKVLTDENTTIGAIGSYTYDGTAKTPDPEVKVGDKVLTKGTDYELSYSNNTAAGTATVTIAGKGDYGGTLTREFTINKADVTEIVAIPDQTYTGQAIMPVLTVKADQLTLDTDDYDAVFSSNTDAGTASVTVTGKGNFTGTKTASFTIAPASITSIEAIPNQTYTGQAITPELTVKAGDLTLGANDYDAEFSNNTKAGTASVTVTGKGNFAGAKNATFTIAKASLATATIEPIADKTYTGDPIKPEVFVQLDGREVSANEYDVTYANNTNVPATNATQLPTVKVTAKDNGNYEGSVSATFNIVPRSVEDAMVEGVPATLTYTGEAITCEDLKVQVGNRVLVSGDYDVTYANNTNAGTATITITGKGNYMDQKAVEFAIEPAAITSLTCVEATPYTGFAIEPKLTVKAGDQLTLTADDYDATFTNNTEVGTATVSVTGKGNYRGTETVTFSIGQVDLGGTSVTVEGIAPKTYDGTEQTQDALVLKLGDYQLVADKDYEIAYGNNTDAGDQATITITAKSTDKGGSGNFTGTKTQTFTIAARSIADATVDGIVDQTYTGGHITPAVTVSMDDRALTLNTDYTVVYEETTNTDVGTSTVTITGKGNYTGTTTTSFSIVPMSLARAVVSVTGEQSYTGAAVTPAPTVKVGNHVVPADAYDVAYANNTNVGTATITVTAKEDAKNYIDSAKGTFKIQPQAINGNDFTITAIPAQTFTGSAIKPEVEVKVNDQEFDAANYDVAYANNTNAGTATVTVTGKGSYAGTKTANFTINPANLANVNVSGIEDKMHTGSALTQDNLTLTLGSYVLKEGVDYEVAYENNVNEGNATITITPKQDGSGNFTGSAQASFRIGSLAIGDIEALTYNGAAQTPTPTVMAGDTVLVAGTDFDFSYTNNEAAGTAKVTATGKGAYAGSVASKEFTITPAAITSVTGAQGATYTGEAITQNNLVVKAGETTLTASDYDITYNNNVNVGTATVIATGKGNYAGKKTTTFAIAAVDLSATGVASITAIPDQTYTGKEIKPAVEVKVGDKVLDAKNYTVTYEDNTNKGEATVTVAAKDGTNYTGTLTANFTIGEKSLDTAQIGAISDQLYTGSAIEPTPTVTVDGKKLNPENYDVTWDKNINVSTDDAKATVTITAKADTNYTGSVSRTFNIKARNIADCTVTSIDAQTYTGAELKPALTITLGDQTLDATNYDVAWTNNTNVGTAIVTITGKNNCTGTTTATFDIAAKGITEAMVEDIASQSYTGSAITPAVTVNDGDKVLIKDTDYTVTYKDNVNAGTATVTITGQGNYAGTADKTFAIGAKSITEATIADISEQAFTGSEIEPTLTVTDDAKTLVAGTDYTVAYSSNTNAGIATATITGAGNYVGTAQKTFSIAEANTADVDVVGIVDMEYKQGVAEYTQSNLAVKLGEHTFGLDADYTVSYADNTGAGIAKLTITPIANGNLTGDAINKEFRIATQLMSNSNTTITLAEHDAYTYDGTQKRPTVSKVTFNGDELVYGTDYTVSYENNTNAGEATVTVTGMGNYAGQASETFSIAQASIAGATVSAIADQPYTGNAITPAVSVTLGDDVLAKDKDYTVAYTNNTNAGTATVAITGTGNYTGSPSDTRTFTITKRSILDASIEPIAAKTYNGTALEPAAVVKLDGKELAASDYNVAYTNNTNVGTATVTVTGGGNFEQGESLTTTFVIKPAQMTEVTGISTTVTYNDGSPITFANLEVFSGINKLTPNKDYILAYRNNINVGKASVTVTARGNYSGSKTTEFLITPKSLTEYTVIMPTNDDGSEIIYSETASLDAFEPVPTVTSPSGIVLDPANYDVIYLNNSVAGTATVIVTGKGNYKDSPSVPGTFTIYKYAGAASGGNNAVIWNVADDGAMTIRPKIKNSEAELSSASNLTWSQAVADYTESVTVDSGVTGCTDASGMFSGLSNATSVDVSDFDMSGVTNTSGMFEDCASLPSVDMSGKITSYVTDMSNMFAGCESLSEISLAGANTSNVSSMAGMFSGCSSLAITSLDDLLGASASGQSDDEGFVLRAQTDDSFITSSVRDLHNMFNGATGLTELNLAGSDTSNVTDMSHMFAGCTSLKKLNIASLSTQSAEDMSGMYDECELDEFTIGPGYVQANNLVGVEALPTPTASNGLWWKTGSNGGARKWVSLDGIIALGQSAADTYTNKGVLDAEYVSIESSDIATDGSSYVYDGNEKKPTVTRVVLKTSDNEEIELVPDADYSVGYEANVNAGTASIVVTGLGDYSGNATMHFPIHAQSITGATVTVGNTTYTGNKANPSVKVVIGGRELVKGRDYTVVCNSVNAGTGTVTITGKGNYKDSVNKSFTINRKAATVTANNARKNYGAKDPTLTASVAGTVGSDKLTYTVTRASGEKAGTYTITPKGNAVQGNYNVTYKTGTFTIVQTGEPAAHVAYKTHVQTFGWQDYVRDGAMSGTQGKAKRLEGIQIKLENAPYSGGIEYRTHVQKYGWQGYRANDAMSGTSGEAKRLEAIQIRLTGEMAKHYDVWYRVHAQTYGWLGWAKNDSPAGTAGFAKRLEGIEIKILPKGSAAPGQAFGAFVTAKGDSPAQSYASHQVLYKTHVQSFGWQGWVADGQTSGTTGLSKRLEGIDIQLNEQPAAGSIEYRTHVQKIGWQDYVRDGAMSGTSGRALRLEAIQIRLTGDMEKKYDVWYRVHAQTFGWMGWAKNDEQAGTAGYGKRLESIQILILPKGSAAPGTTANAFRKK